VAAAAVALVSSITASATKDGAAALGRFRPNNDRESSKQKMHIRAQKLFTGSCYTSLYRARYSLTVDLHTR
jgi:hypothetical protein